MTLATQRLWSALRAAGLAALVLLVTAGPGQAQTETFAACYVPDVGAIYLIGLEGLPTECLSEGHVAVDWNSLDIPDGTPVNALVIGPGGSIGLGTSTPEARLHVKGSLIVENTINGPTAGGNLFLRTFDSGDLLLLGTQTTGNVGIGTTTPTSRLEVNGSVAATSFSGDGSGLTNLPSAGVPGWQRRTRSFTLFGSSATGASVLCSAGQVVLGGGFETSVSPSVSVNVIRSIPRPDGDGWDVTIRNLNPESTTATAYAICADAP